MTKRPGPGLSYLLLAGLFLATVTGCVLYVQRDYLLVHYHVWSLVRGGDPPASSCQWLAERESLALPYLLGQLTSTDATRCARAGERVQALLAGHHDATNPEDAHRTLAVATKLRQLFSELSEPGRAEAVNIAFSVLELHLATWSPSAPAALETAGELFLAGLSHSAPLVQERALVELESAWRWQGADRVSQEMIRDWQRRCYERAVELLQSPTPALRAQAASAMAGAPFHEGDAALIERLRDPDPLVRRAALLSLERGRHDSLSSEQKLELTRFLHDEDERARRAAERILHHAGLSDAVIQLAALMRHSSPNERAKVVSQAFLVPDIDPVRWVLELADDPAPAVRIAVARAAMTSDHPELRKTLEHLAESDPDTLVRETCKQFLAARLAQRPTRTAQ